MGGVGSVGGRKVTLGKILCFSSLEDVFFLVDEFTRLQPVNDK